MGNLFTIQHTRSEGATTLQMIFLNAAFEANRKTASFASVGGDCAHYKLFLKKLIPKFDRFGIHQVRGPCGPMTTPKNEKKMNYLQDGVYDAHLVAAHHCVSRLGKPMIEFLWKIYRSDLTVKSFLHLEMKNGLKNVQGIRFTMGWAVDWDGARLREGARSAIL